MTLSVIIPSYNGAKKLPGILNALKQQTAALFEVIVVLDGSTDDSVAVTQGTAASLPYRIVTQANRGRAAVRNTGARESHGDLLLFFDDDMRPEPGCVQAHLQHHTSYPGIIVTGAQVDDYKKATTDFLKYKCWLSRNWSADLRKHADGPLTAAHLHLTAANLSVNRALFFALDGFDERLTDAEDFDLAIRAHKKGINLYYNYQAFAWHDDVVTVYTQIKRMRQYQAAHQRLRTLKPELYNTVQLRRPNHFRGFKRMALRFFAQPFWLWLIQKQALTFLPQGMRYKLYALVTTAYGSVFTDKPVV